MKSTAQSKRAALSRLILAALVLTSTLGAQACDSGDTIPTLRDLEGVWANTDAGQVRAFHFMADAPADASAALKAKPFVYELYFYTTGAAPVVVQRGHYSVQSERLVTEVVEAPLDPNQAGRKFGNDIKGFTGQSLTLQSDSAATGKRVYAKLKQLP